MMSSSIGQNSELLSTSETIFHNLSTDPAIVLVMLIVSVYFAKTMPGPNPATTQTVNIKKLLVQRYMILYMFL
ncbi:MAG: hypothetical protein M3162_08340 [Thermoproteota archaeon]|nr:hypothetical protein [Thermoproteota archaeon]